MRSEEKQSQQVVILDKEGKQITPNREKKVNRNTSPLKTSTKLSNRGRIAVIVVEIDVFFIE
ncbi:MAG: hypothetical protein BGO55_03355 [Sphingobacteriales bacterium 50-39]|nr:hypothetical protein [Sphingobacteriales bacterium]OJW55591.1 MAG: hypothetical protein BGO55_03355 [Sphingobacteriales bacterium 50-39]